MCRFSNFTLMAMYRCFSMQKALYIYIYIFLQPYVKYYDKMHNEEEFDLFCRCIRANISIMLHKTIYEINSTLKTLISTLLLRNHFKPPSSVCNNFLL